MVEVLVWLHQHFIMHKDINPDSFLINPETLEVKLFKLNRATVLERETQEVVNPNNLEGALAYISPEQTGRMNLNIDYRSDYYSLGIVFYQMLTGELPFIADDAMEYVHSHIAKKAVATNEINQKIPEMVAMIVEKLMAKAPFDRYQSAIGLQADLQYCQKEWDENHEIEPFDLAKNDIFDKFNISQKLYGREGDLKRILETYQRASRGRAESIFIAGYSGVGKTKLISEVHKPITESYGSYCSGKFDQLERGTPYSAIVVALKTLLRQVISEPKGKLESIRQQVQENVGDFGQVIIDLIPEMDKILGKQKALEQVEPEEFSSRFMIAFRGFFRGIARPERPLVMFIDDLQWADVSSLKLIENILSDVDLSNFLFIGAYRDNEVNSEHPLVKTTRNLKIRNAITSEIVLSPLTLANYLDLLSDSLKLEVREITGLGEMLYDKTRGNPFFVKQLLKILLNENILHYSYDRSRWDWNLENIEKLAFSDNVVEVLLEQFKKLPSSLQEILKISSCIGNEFKLQTLLTILKEYNIPAQADLTAAIKNEFVLVSSGHFQMLSSTIYEQFGAASVGDVKFKFSHDRIQQAVYQSLTDKQKQQHHLSIGRIFLGEFDLQKEGKALFVVTDQFLRCPKLLQDSVEKKKVMGLMGVAGNRAKLSENYEIALKYCEAGTALCERSFWKSDYNQVYELHLSELEITYVAKSDEEGDLRADMLVKKSVDRFSRAKVYQIQLRHYDRIDLSSRAFDYGLEALKALGRPYPRRYKWLYMSIALLRLLWIVRLKTPEMIADNLPELNNEEVMLACRVYCDMCVSAYAKSDPLLDSFILHLNACTAVLKNGLFDNALTPIIYFAIGYIELSNRPSNSISIRFKRLARLILTKYPSAYNCAIYYHALGYHLFWHNTIDECIDYVQTAAEYSIKAGNLTDIKNFQLVLSDYYVISGREISKSIQLCKEKINFGQRFSDKDHIEFSRLELEQLESLLTNENIQVAIQNTISTFTRYVDSGREGWFPLVLAYSEFAVYLYLIGDYEGSIHYFEKSSEYIHFSNLIDKYIEFIYFLSLDQIYKEDGKSNYRYLKKMKGLKNKFKSYARKAPQLFEDKYLLMCAELCHLSGHNTKAMRHYERSIKAANETSFNSSLALAHEHAACFYLSINYKECASGHAVRAHYCYTRWELRTRTVLLEEKFPELVTSIKQGGKFSTKTTTLREPSTVTSAGSGLDFISLLKASQAISGEIRLEDLIKKMLHICIENAGAERSLFIERTENQWFVIAENKYQQDQEEFTMLSKPFDEYAVVPHQIIRYARRSMEALVVNNACQDSPFSEDEYIKKVSLKSIMCLPIIHHGALLGIIYLENNLTTNAFTDERVSVLTTLSSQIAISLENARHFEKTQRLYRATERFVPKKFLQILKRDHIEEVKLGDCVAQEISILFMDMRNFTTLIEKRSPNEAFTFVNQFWKCMAPVIRKHGGFINQYQGDAILALFPLTADNAVNAGIQLLEELKTFNEQQKERNEDILEIGIGINSGEAMLGIIGEEERIDAAVISDVTNTAARVETLNKQYGTHFLISIETVKRLKHPEHFLIRIADKVILKGKTKAIYLYEYVDWQKQLNDIALSDYLTLFKNGFDLYEAGEFEQASRLFKSCFVAHENDQIVRLLYDRCELFLREGKPENWDGTYRLMRK